MRMRECAVNAPHVVAVRSVDEHVAAQVHEVDGGAHALAVQRAGHGARGEGGRREWGRDQRLGAVGVSSGGGGDALSVRRQLLNGPAGLARVCHVTKAERPLFLSQLRRERPRGVDFRFRFRGRKPGAGCTLWVGVGVGVGLPQARGAETRRPCNSLVHRSQRLTTRKVLENGSHSDCVIKTLKDISEYSHSKKHIRTMFDCMPILEDDSDFFVLGRQGIRGKLLFKDGIYDKMTEAQLPFTHELYFVHQVPWNIPREKPSTTDDVEKWFFKESFLQAGVPAYLKQMLMRAAFGLGYEELTFETGPGSNGKSARAQAVRNALGPYVADLDGAHVALEERAQPGAASPQTMVLEHARIVYIAEPPKTMVLNMPLFKRLTGGDPISGRNLYKGVVNFNSSAKVWFLVNNIPNFSECDESFMNKRIRQIDSDVRWLGPVEFQGFLTETKKNEAEVGAEGVFKADADRSRSCQAASDALLWLLISEPVAADLAALTPASVIAASRETVAERDEMKRAFDASFEWTRETGDKVASYELASVLKVQGKELCKKMRVWGYGTSKPVRVEGAVVQGYEGIRKRKARWLEDVN